MNTYSAPQRASSPASVTRTSSATGKNAADAADHREREVPGVAGADEDAVEHEHDRGDRLHQRDGPEHAEQLVAHRRVVGEHDARAAAAPRRRTSAAPMPVTTPHSSMRRLLRRVGFRIARAEVPADDRLRRDRDRVEREREEVPELPRDLMRGDLDVADARRDRRGRDEHREQRRGAHREVTADDGRGATYAAVQSRRRVRAPHVAGRRSRGTRLRPRPARSPCPTPNRRRPSRSRTRTGPRARG